MNRMLLAKNMVRNAACILVVAAACSTSATALAVFDTFVSYNVQGTSKLITSANIPLIGPLQASDTESNVVGAPIALQQTVQNHVEFGDTRSHATISMSVFAEIGQFKLSTAGSVLQSYNTLHSQVGEASFTASMIASWKDRFRFSAGANTRLVTIYGHFDVHGTLSASALSIPPVPLPGSNWAAAQLGFTMTMTGGLSDPLGSEPVVIPNIGSYYAAVRESSSPVQLKYNHPVPVSIPYEIAVFIDEWYPLEVFADLDITAKAISQLYRTPGTLQALFAGELGNTISWGGIDRVTDANGQPIENWTITSESGFDYSRPFPIPEPSSIVLLCVCLYSGLASRTRNHLLT